MARKMERPSPADVIRRWVDENEAWLDALDHGAVEFVFTGYQPPRVNRRDSQQLVAPDRATRLTA